MKIGIIADIHGNSSALRKVLSCLEDTDVIINLGDVGNFTTDINDCYELLKSKKIINILGNHELEAAASGNTTDHISIGGRDVPTDFGVNSENKLFIKKSFRKSAKLEADGSEFFFCHGLIKVLNDMICFDYLNIENIEEVIAKKKVSAVFCGHLHRPQLITLFPDNYSQLMEIEKSYSIVLENKISYGFNIGMLSSNKNNPECVQYGILDTSSKKFDYIMST